MIYRGEDDLQRHVADGRLTEDDADAVRTFAAFLAQAPPRAERGQPGYAERMEAALREHYPDDPSVVELDRRRLQDRRRLEGRTGGEGGLWVELDRPKPPRVADVMRWWGDQPPRRSARCSFWLAQIRRGWLPNRRWASQGYHNSAEMYGVWIWEYLHDIAPAIRAERERRDQAAATIDG